MPETAAKKQKLQMKKSQEIVFKQPSVFRKVVSFITAYSMMFLNITPVFASNITGIEGNNGANAHYYPNGGRPADVTFMADNIYANSDKAPNSDVSTLTNSTGYKQTQTTYSDDVFGGKGVIYDAKGINTYGEETPLSLDVISVDKDVVEDIVAQPQRSKYKEQTAVQNIPSKFINYENSFVRLGLKETKIHQKVRKYYKYGNIYVMPENPSLTYKGWSDGALIADVKITEIGRYGAKIVNNGNWKIGEEHNIKLAIDGTKATVKCVVTEVKHNLATVKFTDIPSAVANKIAYRYMKTAKR